MELLILANLNMGRQTDLKLQPCQVEVIRNSKGLQHPDRLNQTLQGCLPPILFQARFVFRSSFWLSNLLTSWSLAVYLPSPKDSLISILLNVFSFHFEILLNLQKSSKNSTKNIFSPLNHLVICRPDTITLKYFSM